MPMFAVRLVVRTEVEEGGGERFIKDCVGLNVVSSSSK